MSADPVRDVTAVPVPSRSRSSPTIHSRDFTAADHDLPAGAASPPTIRLYAGVGTVATATATAPVLRRRGRVVVLIKPDDTVLVHDAAGYQPVAWLTRPATLTVTRAAAPAERRATTRPRAGRVRVTARARAGERGLRVDLVAVTTTTVPAGPVGRPVGGDGRFVRADDAVHDVATGRRHPIPDRTTLLDRTCACGRPLCRRDGAGTTRCVRAACATDDG